jgi:hypothetical protein
VETRAYRPAFIGVPYLPCGWPKTLRKITATWSAFLVCSGLSRKLTKI